MPDIPLPPITLSAAAAFAVSALSALLIRLIGGPGRGGQLAGAAIGLGVLAFLLLELGLPEISPRHLVHRLPYTVGVALLVGLLLDAAGVARGARALVVAGAAAVAVWWLLGAPFGGVAPLDFLIDAAPLLAAWLIVMWRLGRPAADERFPAVALMMAALGLAGLGWLDGGPFDRVAALAVALAAAGFLVWGWPGPRFAFGNAAVLAGGGSLLSLATVQWLSRGDTGFALALLALGLVFFADGMAARLGRPRGMLGQIAAPLQLAGLCVFPIALAVVVGYLAARAG